MPTAYGFRPVEYRRAMVFIDGTNLLYRLEAAKLKVPSLRKLFHEGTVGGRQVERIYLYTIEHHYNKARDIHGNSFDDGIRIVFGSGIPTGDGNIREKGVDALLVADLIYHAAMKNCDYALLVAADNDFAYAIRRVEDFGCGTAVMGVCCTLPELLSKSCDSAVTLERDRLLQAGWATEI